MKTKSVLALFGLMLSSVLNINAQDFRLGVLSGFNVTRTNISEYTVDNIIHEGDYLDPMPSFNINGDVEYKSSGFWGLSIEPGYIKKGGLNPANHKNKVNLNYIELPVLLNLYISKRLFASLGPGISYLLNVKYKYESNSFDIPVSGNRYELSGLIGLNYNIIKNMDIGLRYNRGWASYTKTLGAETGYILFIIETKEVHQSIQFVVRFKI